ncbi:hypothetical protein PFISCL1PPCAC_16293 [Pristionchus fissidentatus]|uniref:Secreted protein n=1 Tax=Pristionchus fissidentatus TaxID=1538716 RepID=A0AAV5W2N2_9BILA|nr:hypothetical protein PFISCL1PPCAC_16293 [Pristionchus fissidentatus]
MVSWSTSLVPSLCSLHFYRLLRELSVGWRMLLFVPFFLLNSSNTLRREATSKDEWEEEERRPMGKTDLKAVVLPLSSTASCPL